MFLGFPRGLPQLPYFKWLGAPPKRLRALHRRRPRKKLERHQGVEMSGTKTLNRWCPIQEDVEAYFRETLPKVLSPVLALVVTHSALSRLCRSWVCGAPHAHQACARVRVCTPQEEVGTIRSCSFSAIRRVFLPNTFSLRNSALELFSWAP